MALCATSFRLCVTLGTLFPALTLLLTLFTTTACTRHTSPDDTLIVAQSAEPRTLDPQAATAASDFRLIENLYDGLVRFRAGTLDIEPALATAWTVSSDGLTYTFTLRPNVRFHDGTPCDAAAVRYTFERMLDPAHPESDTGPFPLAFFFSAVDHIDTPDDATVTFQLKEPFAPFLANLAYPTGKIVSSTAVQKHRANFGRRPVGTGPFRFSRWDSNRRVELLRADTTWQPAAKLRRVIFRPLTDDNTRLTELLAGGVDVITESPVEMIGTFRQNPDFSVIEADGPHLWFLILNTRHGPFADRRVRQAANYAINKTALVEHLLQNTATVANGPVPAAFGPAHAADLAPYPHNPDKARQLIREAGAEGAEVTLYATEGGSGMLAPKAMAEAIQSDLAAVGLRVRIETYEWNTFLSKVNTGLGETADLAEMAWMTNDPDTLPYLTLRSAATPDQGGFNSGYYANPEVDDLLTRARRETNPAARAVLYQKMQYIVHQDAPWVFICNWRQNVVATKRVKNLHLEPSFLFRLNQAKKTDH
ncbi:MAG: ABC transporter substrate-binding protein [Verrucomicrobiota bacterium]